MKKSRILIAITRWQKSITAELASYDTRLVRKIRVKEGRYNQHLADMSLLIEVGPNANTLQDATQQHCLSRRGDCQGHLRG